MFSFWGKKTKNIIYIKFIQESCSVSHVRLEFKTVSLKFKTETQLRIVQLHTS